MNKKHLIRLLTVAVFFMMTAAVFCFAGNEAEAASTFPVYRMYNKTTGEHLFTRVKSEYDRNAKIGWIKEGIAWHSASSGTPVYRLLNLKTKDHHYTKDKHEIDILVKRYGWKVEGTVFYSGGNVAVYRAYNSSLAKGAHHFTANKPEYDVLNSQWRREGVAFYAAKGGDLWCHNLQQKYPGYTGSAFTITKDCGSYYECKTEVFYIRPYKKIMTKTKIRKDCKIAYYELGKGYRWSVPLNYDPYTRERFDIGYDDYYDTYYAAWSRSYNKHYKQIIPFSNLVIKHDTVYDANGYIIQFVEMNETAWQNLYRTNPYSTYRP